MRQTDFSYTVAKFGGTSVADYQAMQRCADIVLADPAVRLVVVSASSGVTNLLVELAKGQLTEAERLDHLAQIARIQYQILDQLQRPAQLAADIDDLLVQMDKLSKQRLGGLANGAISDALLALGECCSSALFAELLRQRNEQSLCFDARRVMRTDNHFGKAEPDLTALKQLLEQHLQPLLQANRVVTQGFIGADSEGNTTTLGRGGSDFSAALMAEALQAEVLAVWTDVDGIYSCDPRLVTTARPIPELSFDEAAEMATFGAKVLHPATILPAVRCGSAVFVGKSRAPEQGGTWIRKEVATSPGFRALSLRKQQTLLTVHSLNMLHARGFLAELFAILAKHRISVDLITTSEVSVALTIDDTGSSGSGASLITPELKQELATMCRVEVTEQLALVAVIGNQLATTAGIAKQVFEVLEPFNVRMICQGASPHNLCFLVDAQEAEPVVQQLHRTLLDD
ncbi:lysine-sensitive aspartokinase 3 [Ferrimonas lipolytica]|uniref:Aspartokinase n=1 Tax=Ferrimonas lipolytica TaxID=2724191 RepID=A0A6H1UB63_9GAMM|nr:lysine-sensitive aspartokinase 3 [Ferrimonas lipolytica]QIZ75446.1 lysine-sensitive aspartokinase 3 [Ferrimonas lipolytica]